MMPSRHMVKAAIWVFIGCAVFIIITFWINNQPEPVVTPQHQQLPLMEAFNG